LGDGRLKTAGLMWFDVGCGRACSGRRSD
jgi:hypothetical protein